MESELLSTKEAAEALGVSARRILQMIDKGQLPAQKIGGVSVINRADVERVKVRPGRGRPVTLPEEKRRKKTAT